MLDLVSTKLAFARDARQLLVIHDDHVAWHATTGDSRRLPIAGVRAIAAFGDQLWTVGPCGLERWSFAGRRLGAAYSLPDDAVLAPAFAGPAAAACGGRMWLDDSATLRDVALADGALPFLGLRAFTLECVRGTRIVRLGPAAWTLPRGSTLLGAAALFDGAGVALFVSRDHGIEAWSSTAAGEVRQRMPLPAGRVRLAARRGIAVVHAGDELTAFDLRYGRPLGTGIAAGDDLALDPDGKFLATLHGGEVRITTLDDAFAEHEQRRSKQMGDMADIAEETDTLRTLGEDALDMCGIPGAGLMGMVNSGIDLAGDLEEGNYSEAVGDGIGVVKGGFDFAKDVGVDTEGAGPYLSAIEGGYELGTGAAKIATDEGYGGQTLDGIHDMLEGVGDGAGMFGEEGELLGKSLTVGMDVGDAIAPYVFGSEEEANKPHTEAIPESGKFNPSTGNGAVDWVFGVGDYTDGRF